MKWSDWYSVIAIALTIMYFYMNSHTVINVSRPSSNDEHTIVNTTVLFFLEDDYVFKLDDVDENQSLCAFYYYALREAVIKTHHLEEQNKVLSQQNSMLTADVDLFVNRFFRPTTPTTHD